MQELKRDSEYKEFYKRMSKEGKYVILDNGAAEQEEPDIIEILRMQEEINASEIVLPDKFFDSTGTYKSTKDAIAYMQGKNVHTNTMAVAQGKDLDEWSMCALRLAVLSVSCIGVPKNLVYTSGPDARMKAIDTLMRISYLTQERFKIHLLGCWTDPREIGVIYAHYGEVVRGVDSGIAAMYTQAGLLLDPDDAPKPGDNKPYLDFQGELNEELLKENIKRWEQYCHGLLH
jgi:hypothetical protein